MLLLTISAAIIANAQTQSASCEVRPLWADKQTGLRSANLGSIGTFRADPSEQPTIRSFKLAGSDLVTTAAVRYQFDYSGRKPRLFNIAMSITVSDHENRNLIGSIDSSEASTRYRKNWNLSVTKNVAFDNRTYMFTLKCWEGAIRPAP